ncbi:hypothetical protein [Streptomyces sp. NBC_01451]|uniref:hypothetical protein n=1 Tax=Streptomyces sp. NBC_01451 TaxID=2903872 RepID=UPI002E379B75|nr:hypothetical protein [Streptomyces sp. NBC_01451]
MGQVVLARRSAVSAFTRAWVTSVRPSRDGSRVRIALVWLADDERPLTPVAVGERATVYQAASGWPPLIKALPAQAEEDAV